MQDQEFLFMSSRWRRLQGLYSLAIDISFSSPSAMDNEAISMHLLPLLIIIAYARYFRWRNFPHLFDINCGPCAQMYVSCPREVQPICHIFGINSAWFNISTSISTCFLSLSFVIGNHIKRCSKEDHIARGELCCCTCLFPCPSPISHHAEPQDISPHFASLTMSSVQWFRLDLSSILVWVVIPKLRPQIQFAEHEVWWSDTLSGSAIKGPPHKDGLNGTSNPCEWAIILRQFYPDSFGWCLLKWKLERVRSKDYSAPRARLSDYTPTKKSVVL